MLMPRSLLLNTDAAEGEGEREVRGQQAAKQQVFKKIKYFIFGAADVD